MNDTFVVTYEQLQPQLFLSAGPSATKHVPNSTVQYPVRAMSAARWGLEWLTIEVLCLVAAPDSPVCSDFLL
jgi:hypothetical protein